MNMNLLKIICFCIIAAPSFSGDAIDASENSKLQNKIATIAWVGNQQIDDAITKGLDNINELIGKNPHIQQAIEKVSPYFSNFNMLTDSADQKLFLTFVAGSVLSQNDYLYFITLPTTAYYAERSLKSIADAWRISAEEKQTLMTVRGISLDARELFIVTGLAAMLIKRNIYSATFLAGAYAFAHLTRENKEKRFDAGSFLAYMILLNTLNSLNA